MAQFVNMFQVNLKNSSSQIANINTVYQGNANANRVGAVVFDGKEPYPLAGTCAGAVSRDNGTFVPLVGVVSGNEAYVVLDSNCYEVLGPLRITITVTNGNEETTLIAIYGNVEATGSGNIIQPAERLPDYVQLLGEIQAMRTATAAAVAELAGLGEQISYFSELSSRMGAKTVYADLPGFWKTDGTLNPYAGVHTRLIPVKGYTKIYGRTYMDHNGVAVAYFDESCELIAAVSIVGSDETPNLRFGNNRESDPLTIPDGAYYASVSGWGDPTDYPILFWGPPTANAEIESFDPGVRSTGSIEHMGVSYVDFGARLDGVHDDTDAVIACHNYANTHGCKVYNHRGTVLMSSASNANCAEIKTDVDWTGTTFLIKPPMENEKIIFAVSPEETTYSVSLTAEQIAQLRTDALNIPFLKADYPNCLAAFMTDIVIGLRDGESDYTEQSYYSETVTADRNGGLMDGALFYDMSGASSVSMRYRSIMDPPITIKGGRFLRAQGSRFVNPYYLYISRANVTVEGLEADTGDRVTEGNAAYRAEYIRADYAYNLCFRDCVFENFTNFFAWDDRYSSNVSYVLVCTHCSNILIDHCHFLRGWGPIQTSWCKRLTVRDSVMGRVDNHYGGRDYLIEGCTMVTSHSNINMGFGDGYLTVRDCKFIKTRDYDTIMVSPLIHCREDMCAIFSGNITVENIQIETDYATTVLQAAFLSASNFKKAESDRILPLKLPKVRMKNIFFRHVSASPVTLTLAEYGARAEASALSYGYVEPDNMIIDGVWSDQSARILPMLEHVHRTGNERWMVMVANYDCAISVTQDSGIDPTEDLTVDTPLMRMLPDIELAIQELGYTEEQTAGVIAAYIAAHPEAIAEVTVAVPDELTAFLGLS